MKQGTKMIEKVFGILLTIMLLFTGAYLYKKGEAPMADAVSDYDKLVSQFGNAELIMFENGSASGSDVLNLISGLDSSSGYTISVTNGKNNTQVYATTGDPTTSETLADLIADAKKKTDSNYINPNAVFTSSVTKDANGVVTQVEFVQVK